MSHPSPLDAQALTPRAKDLLFAVELSELILEHLPDAVLLVDESGLIQRLNAEAERLFGYPHEALLGKTVGTLVPEALRERHLAHRLRYALEPRRRPMGRGLDLQARHRDGQLIPVDIMLTPIATTRGTWVIVSVRSRAAEEP